VSTKSREEELELARALIHNFRCLIMLEHSLSGDDQKLRELKQFRHELDKEEKALKREIGGIIAIPGEESPLKQKQNIFDREYETMKDRWQEYCHIQCDFNRITALYTTLQQGVASLVQTHRHLSAEVTN
jgi:hypothetical protein